jgi:hypothetical protein
MARTQSGRLIFGQPLLLKLTRTEEAMPCLMPTQLFHGLIPSIAARSVKKLARGCVTLCRRRLRTCQYGLQNCWPDWSNWIMVLLRSCHPLRRWRSSLDGRSRRHEVAQAATAKIPKSRLAGPDAIRPGRAWSIQEFQYRSSIGALVVNGPVIAQTDFPRTAPKPNPFLPGGAVYKRHYICPNSQSERRG